MPQDHPMTNPDVAEVAGALSDRQKEALLACDARDWRTAKEAGIPMLTLVSLCWFWPNGTTIISPCISLLTRDYQDSPLRYIYRLTPLGIRVRQYLNTPSGERDDEHST
jgi:hypothetical protein